MRTHQPAAGTAIASRAEPKGAERAPARPRPVQANRLLAAAHPAQWPVHQFANLALERATNTASPPNRTGLPDRLKADVEHLSGFAMDDVRVHYNSPKPATVQALAYTKGTEIHVGPGQEKHLPHEAWHVVQQAQGRVKPTLQMKGAAINDDAGLEKEAELMGARALRGTVQLRGREKVESRERKLEPLARQGAPTVQRKVILQVAAGTITSVKFDSRPAWRKAVSEKFGQYDAKLENIRHKVGWDHLESEISNSLVGKTLPEAYDVLKDQGITPKSNNEADIKLAITEWGGQKFNDLDNLYLGEAAANQALGRKVPQAKRLLQKAEEGTLKYPIKVKFPGSADTIELTDISLVRDWYDNIQGDWENAQDIKILTAAFSSS